REWKQWPSSCLLAWLGSICLARTSMNLLRALPASISSLLASCLVLSACGQGQPSPAGKAAAPAASASSDWETVLAAAKREGKVTVMGPVGDQLNTLLIDPFQKQYGITVDLTALPGNAATSRINTERAAGQYNLDVLIAGSAGSLDSLIPNKALEPIESALILPEVKDPQKWRGGALPAIGPNHEIL